MTARTLPSLLLAKDSTSWGDERERAVMLDGYAYAFVLTQILTWTVGAVVAWFTPPWVAVVLFLAFVVPSIAWQRYTKSHDVDAHALTYARGSVLRTSLTGAYFGLCALSMALAVIAHTSSGDSSSMSGAVVGGVCGAAAAIFGGWWYGKKKAARNDADLPDEL